MLMRNASGGSQFYDMQLESLYFITRDILIGCETVRFCQLKNQLF